MTTLMRCVRLFRARVAGHTTAAQQDEAGFTLLELLIVVIILPLIFGAVAGAIIVSLQNGSGITNRLSDSVNAQTSAAYFVTDTQGASEVTTNQNLAASGQPAGTYSPLAPQVCPPPSSAVSPQLLVGLYRPVTTTLKALSVGYWQIGTGSTAQVVRESCTLDSNYNATSPVQVVLADPPIEAPLATRTVSGSATIQPAQFASTASTSWVYASSFTLSASNESLPANSIVVDASAGFTSGHLAITTSIGIQDVTCTSLNQTTNTFSGCSGGTGLLSIGNEITQQTISGIQLNVTESPTNYQFNLLGTPRAGGTVNGVFPGADGPTMLLLGNNGLSANGVGSQKGPFCPKGDRICANGALVQDGGGQPSCGNANITSNGYYAVNTPLSGWSCGTQVIAPTPPVPDPIAPNLPPCFPSSLPNLPTYTSIPGGNLTPGIYKTGSPVSGGTLEPGVYVFADGVSGNFTMATPSSSDQYYQNPPGSGSSNYDATAGVLMYLPGAGPYPAGCLTWNSNPGQDNITGDIVPLDAVQSAWWFNGNKNLAYMWLWQDKTNSNSLTMQGSQALESHYQIANENPDPRQVCEDPTDNTPLTVPPDTNYYGGLMYLPSATLLSSSGSPTITVGRAVVGGLSFNGTPAFALTGC